MPRNNLYKCITDKAAVITTLQLIILFGIISVKLNFNNDYILTKQKHLYKTIFQLSYDMED